MTDTTPVGNPTPMVDRSYGNYQGENWYGQDLRNHNWIGSDLSGACLAKVNAEGSWLTGCVAPKLQADELNLKGGMAVGVVFTDSLLSLANFEGVHGSRSDFSGCKLDSARMQCGTYERASFVGAELRDANLEGAKFVNCNFDRAVLVKAKVAGATFERCVFARSQLSGVDFSDATVVQCTFYGADFGAQGQEAKGIPLEWSSPLTVLRTARDVEMWMPVSLADAEAVAVGQVLTASKDPFPVQTLGGLLLRWPRTQETGKVLRVRFDGGDITEIPQGAIDRLFVNRVTVLGVRDFESLKNRSETSSQLPTC